MKLTIKDKELIEEAKKVIKKNYREDSKISSSTGASLRTIKGRIYKGVNIEIKSSAPTSICAEMGAIAQMVSNGERKIETIVALVFYKGKYAIGSPCGACRHIINQFGNPYVIISNNKKVKLKELYH